MSSLETTPEELDATLRHAGHAAPLWAAVPAGRRADALRAIAKRLDDAAPELIQLAVEETHLGETRLAGELKRTTFQLRLFGRLLESGEFFDARIDHADAAWPMGPRPDLRRVMEPIGPVLVFAASNFPFAFSVAGGDTCAALAAGCPVVLKAHSGHPRLSRATGEIVGSALADAGAAEGVFSVIFGVQSGRAAIVDHRIRAAAFTGSIPGGRALFDLAVGRPDPIPFFGELGSLNPVFVTKAAADARSTEIREQFFASFTLGAGQFCTKPGVLLVPEGSRLSRELTSEPLPGSAPMLNQRILDGYLRTRRELLGHAGVQLLAGGGEGPDGAPSPSLITTTVERVLAEPRALLTECFGPTALVVRYHDERELLEVAGVLDGQLTATLVTEDDDEIAAALLPLLARVAGRVLVNQWPTGVTVSYAQQHGGPYPASTSPGSTSVGTASIARFQRPVAYQGVPDALLPPALQDANPLGIPRLVDGVRE